jgi:putative Mg2+ transporter-C (MgtC) family protein
MPTTLEWYDIGWRLALTVFAGAVIGINRAERGRSAGLRTTILVCLAASVSMIQVNLLLATAGRHPDSFIMLDLMRLPLGILTGMGFIGGGAILRRGRMIQGVTTAATLWLVTVIGLCLGGGQIGLGMVTLTLAMVVLWALKKFETSIPQDHRAVFTIQTTADGPTEQEIRDLLLSSGYRIWRWTVTYKSSAAGQCFILSCELSWHAVEDVSSTPSFIDQLKSHAGVSRIRWSG